MKEIWFCRKCGSTDIRHEATARWNAESQEFEVVDVLDDTWCEACLDRDEMREDQGEPTWGIPGEEEEHA